MAKAKRGYVVAGDLLEEISRRTEQLNDDDYIDCLEEIEEAIKDRIEAKKLQLTR